MDQCAVAVENLVMSYGSTPVLNRITLTLAGGEIVGLLGENGAGKSTLAKLLRGQIFPVSGRILIDGEPVRKNDPRAAGIPQESTLAPDLTVLENLFLGRELVRCGWLRKKEMRRRSAETLALFAPGLDPDRPVFSLSAAEKQAVEMARAFLHHDCRLLIMDEPTTILNEEETERLFTQLRRRREAGTAILYISHKLEEVRRLCDRVIVLRDGCVVREGDPGRYSAVELAGFMVGRPLDRLYPEPLPEPDLHAEPLLLAEHLSDGGKVRDVSLALYPGEILGVAGLAGAGRSEFAELVCGLRRQRGGRLICFGQVCCFRNPQSAAAAGITLLPEDRREKGIFPEFPVFWNITLPMLKRKFSFGGLWLSRAKEKFTVKRLIEALTLHPADPAVPAGALSGGNQQKMLVARGLAAAPRLFLFDEPTRGVDVAARYEIYCEIRRLAAAGVGCLVISSDLPELIGLCRRVAVFREGRSVGECRGANLTEKNLICLATGAEK